MNQNITTNHTATLQEHIYAFIDSKLQFINYQIESTVKSFKVKDSIVADRHLEIAFHHAGRFEEVLRVLEEQSRIKGKLLLMRSKLDSHNAPLLFDLLTGNKFQYYSEKRLSQMLDKVAEE